MGKHHVEPTNRAEQAVWGEMPDTSPAPRSFVALGVSTVIALALIIYSIIPDGAGPAPAALPVPRLSAVAPVFDGLPTSATGSPSAVESPLPTPSSPSAAPSVSATVARPTAARTTPGRPAQTTTPAGSVTAHYAIRTDWGEGFVADAVVRNAGDQPATWVVDLVFSADIDVLPTNVWNATVERTGNTYRFRGTSALQARQSVQFGFVAAKRRHAGTASRCTVNGRACA